MYRISGRIQNYAWGITGGLSAWYGGGGDAGDDAGESDKPQAELWYGAHVNGPSRLVGADGQSLRDVVEPGAVPLLVKLLAAARPLSIQVHPPADQAEKIFAEQQADPARSKLLADPLAKTEMLIALRPFSVLQGMRDPALAAAILRNVGGAALSAAAEIEDDHTKAAIRMLLQLPEQDLLDLGSRLPAAAAAAGLSPGGVEALAMVVRDYPGDPGVLVAALLEHQQLQAGEGVYVPAGVVHAYVNGTGVEVMTASDNVLRLGLTPKTIAVDEALAAFNPQLEPAPLRPAEVPLRGGGTLRSFAPEDAPFNVDWVTGGSFTAGSGRYRLILAVSGLTKVSAGTDTYTLALGEAAAVLADEPVVEVSSTGSVFIATANITSANNASANNG